MISYSYSSSYIVIAIEQVWIETPQPNEFSNDLKKSSHLRTHWAAKSTSASQSALS